jgi:hypothetical protein
MALIKLNTRSIPDDAVTPAKVSQNHGRRRLNINGAMQVAQRGTSSTLTTGYGPPDRFAMSNGSIGNLTTTQESTNGPSGDFKYSMFFVCHWCLDTHWLLYMYYKEISIKYSKK